MDMTVATEVEEAAKAKKRIGKLIAYVDGVRKLVSKKKGIVYQGIVRLPKGKKLTKVFTVEQDAIDWRIAEIAKLAVRQVTNVGDQKTPGEMTMPQLFAFYEEEFERRRRKPLSYGMQRHYVRLSAHPIFANLRVVDLLPEVVNEYCISRKNSGADTSTINVEYAMLHVAVTRVGRWKGWGMKLADGRVIKFNPLVDVRAQLVEDDLISESEERDRTCEGDELPRLLAHFKATEWKPGMPRPPRCGRMKWFPMADLVAVLAGNAFRCNELMKRLTWTNLREKGIVLVRKDPSNKKTGTRECLVPLRPEVLEIIRRQPRVAGEDRIFPFNHHSVWKRFKKACKDLNIADLRLHDMRHEAITNLSQVMDLTDLMLVTGHKTIKNLKRYLNHKAKHVANVSEKMARAEMVMPA